MFKEKMLEDNLGRETLLAERCVVFNLSKKKDSCLVDDVEEVDSQLRGGLLLRRLQLARQRHS